VRGARCELGGVDRPRGRAEPVADTLAVVGRFESVLGAGLASLLQTDRRIRVLASGLEHVAVEDALRQWAPHVAILPHTIELSAIERLQAVWPEIGVMVFGREASPADAIRLLAAGANFVALEAPDVDILEAVHKTASGERFFVAADGRRVERRYPRNAESLTEREREVLALLVRDASYRQVAVALGISVRTAQKHAANIFPKLGVRRRRDVVGIRVPADENGVV
jgi:DNA-binding NarL/FixJ family response regulator